MIVVNQVRSFGFGKSLLRKPWWELEERPLPLRRKLTRDLRRDFSSKSQKPNREHLVRVFNDGKYYKAFNRDQRQQWNRMSTSLGDGNDGLFLNSRLNSPTGLIKFSEDSLMKAKSLVLTMLQEVNTESGKLHYIRKLDQLSDLLCRVIDVAEFIRVAHPDDKWVEAAQRTHEIMFGYMNQLNTNTELSENLRKVLGSRQVTSQLSEEEIEVGKYLEHDFERSGIHMDPKTRDDFVSITQDISLLGANFIGNVNTLESLWCEVRKSDFDLLPDDSLKKNIMYLQKNAPAKNTESIYIPLVGSLPHDIMMDCPVEGVRKDVWVALHNTPQPQVDILNKIAQYRAYLAKMLGYDSFCHYQLEYKLAKNPENVMAFLKNVQESLVSRGGVIGELKHLASYKEDGQNKDLDILDAIKPWDRDYLLARLHRDEDEPPQDISPYLSVGLIVAGLSDLFSLIFNIAIIPEATREGETWDVNQVRKLAIYDMSTNKKLGYIYVDFWSHKVQPSHFTVVCLREINSSIQSESVEELKGLVQLDEEEQYQLPVISLVCNFGNNRARLSFLFGKEPPTLLSLDQVETLFHEMGHAMHSMISRTKLHNLSGTRCQTDFVELPSVLMESFAKDPRVLCKVALHYETGEPLPESLLKEHQTRRAVLSKCETFMQSKMAMLDQALHNEDVITNFYDFDSTSVYHKLEARLKVFADIYSTWHARFLHLFSYGAVYYSYLLDRAIAEKIWACLFSADPWSREAGQKYKESILKWGGTRDPWVCLADALDDPSLKLGDKEAIKKISTMI